MYAEVYIKDELLVSWQSELFDIYDNSRMLHEQSDMSLEDKCDYREYISAEFIERIQTQMFKNCISKYHIILFFPSKLNYFSDEETND